MTIAQRRGVPVTREEKVIEQLEFVTRQTGGLDPLVERLIEIRGWLESDLTEIDRSCKELLQAGNAFASDNADGETKARASARHLLNAPGKWIRPICLLIAARTGGRQMDHAVRDLALVCELVHAATLLHDDVLDEGTARRGVPASRIVYGNSASVLGGDHVLIHALRLAHEAAPKHIFSALLDTIDKMVNAEAHQLRHKGSFNPSREVYETVILGKTAVLFRWALLAGGNLAGLTRAQENALGKAGAEMGMAFQLVDDILDLVGSAQKTGKSLYADLQEGKMTWPLILAAERSESAVPLFKAVSRGDGKPEDLVALLHQTGAIEATREEARKHRDTALELLMELPDSKARRALEGLVLASVERSI